MKYNFNNLSKVIASSSYLDKFYKTTLYQASANVCADFMKWFNQATPLFIKTSLKDTAENDIIIDTEAYKLHNLKSGPATTVRVSCQEALEMYRWLKMSRRLQLAASSLYWDKKIRGFCHLHSGQEAIAVGMKGAIRDKDSIIASYRCHAWAYLMNGTPTKVLAELTGRQSGCSKGRGGSMHMYSGNFYGGNGIVGAQVPLGAGLALAHKYLGTGGVSFTLYGDGAATKGRLSDAFNISQSKQLPVVFVCENNSFGVDTSDGRSAASPDYYRRGDNIPGIRVDGTDVLAVREATKFAIEYCTSGKGPLLIEMVTYHCHDRTLPGAVYPTREEMLRIRRTKDPIDNFKVKILSNKLVTLEHLREIDAEVRNEVIGAVKNAIDDPEPAPEELGSYVYGNSVTQEIRGTTPLIAYSTASNL